MRCSDTEKFRERKNFKSIHTIKNDADDHEERIYCENEFKQNLF